MSENPPPTKRHINTDILYIIFSLKSILKGASFRNKCLFFDIGNSRQSKNEFFNVFLALKGRVS